MLRWVTTRTALPSATVGDLIREWRTRRRHSQLGLAALADVSARHLGFLETGRARPSREMVLRLAAHLEVPLRERNQMLLAAGFAPEFTERGFADAEMDAVRDGVERVLSAHQPYPAVAVDRWWNVVAANPAAAVLGEGAAPHLLEPVPNSYRITLHPDGMAKRISNFQEYAPYLITQLRHDVATTADSQLTALLEEVLSYRTTRRLPRLGSRRRVVVVPLRLDRPDGELALFTTITTFGTPADVTVSELAIESFFPADAATARRLRQLAHRDAPDRLRTSGRMGAHRLG
jgi:transcriptional regulator with XRE-family HTH domain